MRPDDVVLQGQLRLVPIFVIGFVLALFLGHQIGHENYRLPVVLVGGSAAAFVAFAMGKKIWLAIPLALSISVPLLPIGFRMFEAAELVIPGVTLLFVARVAMKDQPLTIMRMEHLGLLLYFGWVLFTFMRNPSGLLIFGAETGGARFYFRIFVGFFAFLYLTNVKYTEKNYRTIIFLMIAGAVITVVQALLTEKLFGRSTMGDGDAAYYTWHQTLSPLAILIALWILSRRTLDQIFSFSNVQLPIIILLCLVFSLFSGKRAGFISLAAAPFIAAILQRQGRFIVLYVAGMLLAVLLLVVGHGRIFDLPPTMQRTLVHFPGRWDAEVLMLKQDTFRSTLRTLAIEQIARDPLFGKGGFAFNIDEAWSTYYSTANRALMSIYLHAKGSSWHNTWLGISADFGIPAAIFWGVYWIQFLFLSWFVWKHAPPGSYMKSFAFLILLSMIIHLLRSWTSGHAAYSPYREWWMFGVIVSSYVSLTREKAEEAAPGPGTERRP